MTLEKHPRYSHKVYYRNIYELQAVDALAKLQRKTVSAMIRDILLLEIRTANLQGIIQQRQEGKTQSQDPLSGFVAAPQLPPEVEAELNKDFDYSTFKPNYPKVQELYVDDHDFGEDSGIEEEPEPQEEYIPEEENND